MPKYNQDRVRNVIKNWIVGQTGIKSLYCRYPNILEPREMDKTDELARKRVKHKSKSSSRGVHKYSIRADEKMVQRNS